MPCQNEMKLILVLADDRELFFQIRLRNCLKFTSRLNQLASDHNLMHFFVSQRCCSTLSAGLASCWRSCRLGSVQGCCQPGGSAMLSVRRPVGDVFGPALRWRRCRPSVVLATQSGRRHHVMVMVMLSARRLTTLSRHSLGDAVCQASCW